MQMENENCLEIICFFLNAQIESDHILTDYLRRRIFEGKLSVSPYFLHHCHDNYEAGMLLADILSLKTLGVYLFIIF